MSLYFQYGAYTTLPCSARISAHSVEPILYNNFAVAYRKSVTIEAYLYITSTAVPSVVNLTAEMQALQDALQIPNQSGGIAHGGGQTVHWVSNSGALGGVQVSAFQWLDTPTHLAVQAKFSVTLSAEYANGLEPQNIVMLKESVEIIGEGGADTPLAPQVGALSIRQTIQDYTDVTVTQAGTITGRAGYPNLPTPLIATAGARQVKLTRDFKEPEQVRFGIRVFNRQYAYTFTLPAHPGAITPNVVT